MCKALEELRMEGVLQGRTEGIRATVKTCKKFQINKEAIIETIGKEFSNARKRGRRICRKILVTQKKTAGVTASSGSLSRMRSFPADLPHPEINSSFLQLRLQNRHIHSPGR